MNTTTLADTIGRMRGKEGTTVKIGILREGSAEPLQFTLKRSRVELRSVKSELLEPGMGYVRISQFSETTGDDLDAALKDLRKRNGAPLKGLVLDLRNNPGGVLEAAVSVSDTFLDSGVIVTAKGRTAESKFEMDATPGDALNGAPIVVLGQRRIGIGRGDRRRGSQGQSPGEADGTHDVRQGLGADGDSAGRRPRHEAHDLALLHAVGNIHQSPRHRSRHRTCARPEAARGAAYRRTHPCSSATPRSSGRFRN